MNVGLVFLAALVTALATGLGALPLVFGRHIRDRGLGLATARGLAAAGMKVAVFDVNMDAANAAAKRITPANPNVTATSTQSLWARFR